MQRAIVKKFVDEVNTKLKSASCTHEEAFYVLVYTYQEVHGGGNNH